MQMQWQLYPLRVEQEALNQIKSTLSLDTMLAFVLSNLIE
tara:strand:- start:10812 stop:10931 length:120 start_codon:yes stop_codon:yes gene_type:complete